MNSRRTYWQAPPTAHVKDNKHGRFYRLYPGEDGMLVLPAQCSVVGPLPDERGWLIQWFKPRIRITYGRREI